MKNSQIKSCDRVRNHGEVFTAEREVKAMCDLVAQECDRIDSRFLEPACGNGNFLIEILSRKFMRCESVKDGLKSLNSIFGVDIMQDNVNECRVRLMALFKAKFPEANDYALSIANKLLKTHIICDDFLNPKTDIVKSCGITADESYVKTIERLKQKGAKQ